MLYTEQCDRTALHKPTQHRFAKYIEHYFCKVSMHKTTIFRVKVTDKGYLSIFIEVHRTLLL